MKFEYEYRTSDNVPHKGVIAASDREAAFLLLKAQGIKPGRLTEAPGFFNKLLGKGKRWLAIGVLALALIAVLLWVRNSENAERYAFEDRAQLFGDPSILQKLSQNGWRTTFPDEGEAWLARHAIPGKPCDCPKEGMWRPEIADFLESKKTAYLAIEDADSDELKKMKRMVNGMKREFAEYVVEPQDAIDYINKSCERCRIEKGVYDNVSRDIANLEKRLESEGDKAEKFLSDWDKKNATLRSLGLPTIPQPE